MNLNNKKYFGIFHLELKKHAKKTNQYHKKKNYYYLCEKALKKYILR